MGYQYTDDGVLYLDGPVDPDKVARVALDCLTACVECQVYNIMKFRELSSFCISVYLLNLFFFFFVNKMFLQVKKKASLFNGMKGKYFLI